MPQFAFKKVAASPIFIKKKKKSVHHPQCKVKKKKNSLTLCTSGANTNTLTPIPYQFSNSYFLYLIRFFHLKQTDEFQTNKQTINTQTNTPIPIPHSATHLYQITNIIMHTADTTFCSNGHQGVPIATPPPPPSTFLMPVNRSVDAQRTLFTASTTSPCAAARFKLTTVSAVVSSLLFIGIASSNLSSNVKHGGSQSNRSEPSFPITFVSAVDPAASSPTDAVVTFGYLRTSFPNWDPEPILAGYMAVIHYMNANRYAPNVRYQLNVTTIPCTSSASCMALSPEHNAIVENFLDSMGNFTAVFRPNAFLSPRVAAAAKRGASNTFQFGGSSFGIPVFDPIATDPASFEKGSEHMIHFNSFLSRQIDHLFTYMTQNFGCARSGIIYGQMDNPEVHLAHAKALFVQGGMPTPPAIHAGTVTDEELVSFFTGNVNRRCFLSIINLQTFNTLMTRMKNLVPSFDPTTKRFYATNNMASDAYLFNSSTAIFKGMYFTLWSPLNDDAADDESGFAHRFQEGYDAFFADANNNTHSDEVFIPMNGLTSLTLTSPAAIRAHFASGAVPEKSFMTRQAWRVMFYAVEAARSAVGTFYDFSSRVRTGSGTTVRDRSVGSVPISDELLATGQPFLLEAISHAQLLDALYSESRTIDGYTYRPLSRTCPSLPVAQTDSACFCNTVASTAFIYSPNVSSPTGSAVPVWDDTFLGQREIASMEVKATCGYQVSTWSYPISALVMYPPVYVPSATRGVTKALMESWHAAITKTLGHYAYATNYAQRRPMRPCRLVPFVVTPGLTTQQALTTYVDSYNPFITFGSLEGRITNTSELTLFPAWLAQREEDEALVPHEQWNFNTLAMLPSIAEYIHGLVAFYAAHHVDNVAKELEFIDSTDGDDAESDSSTDQETTALLLSKNSMLNRFFSSIKVLVATAAEAALISKSLATFGFHVPVEEISVLGYNASLWEALLSKWLEEIPEGDTADISFKNEWELPAPKEIRRSLHTFIMVASFRDQNFVLSKAFQKIVANSKRPVTLGLVVTDSTFLHTVQSANFSNSASEQADIVFPMFRSEFWSPNAIGRSSISEELEPYFLSPFLHTSYIAHQFTLRLAELAESDVSASAADILYNRLPTITIDDLTFGPFSNVTCARTVVEQNQPNRNCQCKKGSRKTFIHSARDFQNAVATSRTNKFTNTLRGCGIIYTPYVHPPAAAESLSAASIAGIAVGGSVFLIGCIVAFAVINYLCLGRNNHQAPKDASKPFAVVFTDIQSSTALWARAPATMSEAVEQHHAIMRKVIRRNDGYEVKTVGDSFMVAFKDVDDAVTFALEAQVYFNDADWSDEIDAIYIELLAEAGIGGNGEDLLKGHHRNHLHHRDRDGNGGDDDYSSSDGKETTSDVVKSFGNRDNSYLGSHSHHHHNKKRQTDGTTTDTHSQSHHSKSYASGVGAINNNNNSNITPAPIPAIYGVSVSAPAAAVGSPPGARSIYNTSSHALNSPPQQHRLSPRPQQLLGGGDGRSTTNGNASVHSANFSESDGGGGGGMALPNNTTNNHPQHSMSPDHTAIVASNTTTNNNNANGSSTSPRHQVLSPMRQGNASYSVELSRDESDHGGGGDGIVRILAASSELGVRSPPLNALADPSVVAYPRSTANTDYAIANNMFDPAHKPQQQLNVVARSDHNNTSGGGNRKENTYISASWVESQKPPPPPSNTAASVSSITDPSAAEYRRVSKAENPWHGLRVRIGVHYGMGDIREDPISQGYDYYGTVVNTAARVEGVGHGGQILVTADTYAALSDRFAKSKKAVVISLGPQPLRGLDSAVTLFQMVPATLEARRFPALRLHIEKETEDTDATDTATNTVSSEAEPPEAIAARICASKQFQRITADDLLLHYYYFFAMFGPSNDKYKAQVITKLAQSWGFEKAAQSVKSTNTRNRLVMTMIAKITKTFIAARKANSNRRGSRAATRSNHTNNNTVNNSTLLADSSIYPLGGAMGGSSVVGVDSQHDGDYMLSVVSGGNALSALTTD